LAGNTTLTALSLSGNRLVSDREIQSLLRNTTLTELEANHLDISSTAAVSLAMHPSLRTLSIRRDGMSAAVKALIEAVWRAGGRLSSALSV
jgi:hypothetical protein